MLKKYLFSGLFMSTLFFSPLSLTNSMAVGRSCQAGENRDFISAMKENFKNMNWNAKITGVITGIDDTNLTIMVNNKIYQVDIREAMHKARFGAQSSALRLAVDDKVNIVGNWSNDERTAIKAVYIRNISIDKRWHKQLN